MNTMLIQDFATLLYQDEALVSLISTAVSKDENGIQYVRDEFRRQLRRYASDLKLEAPYSHHLAVVGFVSTFSAKITRELFSKLSLEAGTQIPESAQSIQDRRERVETYLRQMIEPTETSGPVEESDQDSELEEAGEEPYDGSLEHLDHMERFILESAAYQALHHRFRDIVYPNLRSKLCTLMARWSDSDHKYHGHVVRYNLPNLVAELQHINPDAIEFNDYGKETGFLTKNINRFQNLVELWTRERWDWWPLPQYSRPLKEGETRLRWECTCGEYRQAEVPSSFAKRLRSIIRSLAPSSTPPENIQPPPASYQGNGSGSATNRSSQSHGQSTQSSQRYDGQSVSSSPANASQPRLRFPASTNPPTMHSHRVLFVVKRGADYKMAQIGVRKLPCHVFFSTLRAKYFELRGSFRGWFSVWRYSHCDFYMCEKFDDHEFAPKHKNAFPEHTNTDYEYQPKPMDNIPPVSEHEFQKRFYACHKSRPLHHWYHKCKPLGSHSYDILDLFPKKKTEFEEGGDKREIFWGIYAREIISLRWVLTYNLVCVFPMLAFLLVWIIPAGQDTDLQNPSVPFSMMLGFLSLFWSIFLSSLQFGRPH
ncbi:hypothetical protein F4776DRAFT_633767 [Hypoxylon sp. NC0597]|nr:hypothetical protein F4776DRAFT_633767 [Hypoxylon sp. NC0597]